MASKKPKSELVAICKLEFYRKQKNWRYCPPERKGKDSKRRTKTSNAKLNQTYNITRAPEKQEPSPPETPDTEERHILDEAFVDTETGTESDELAQREDQDVNALETGTGTSSMQLDPPSSPYSPKWSIQRWAERRRLWNPEPTPTSDPSCHTHVSTCPTDDLPCPIYASKHPTLDPTRPDSDPTVPQQTYLSEDANCPIFDNNYNKIQQDVYYSNHYLNLHHKGTDYDSNYPTQSCDTKYQDPIDPKCGVSMVYYNTNMYHQGFNVPQSGANLDVGQACEWQVGEWQVGEWQVGEWQGDEWQGDDWERCAGEGALWSDPDWLEEVAAVGAGGEDAVDGDWRLNNLSDVSHCDSLPSVASSEFIRGAALAPHSTQIDLLVGPEPARLPAAALAAAVARHSAALRALLSEAQRRQQVTKAPYSLDEVPVRDPGPDHPPALFHERIVARSRPAPDLRGHTRTVGHTETVGHTGTVGHTETVGHTGTVGHTETVWHTETVGHTGTVGQDEGGRGRGRLKFGIRMGRPYRL